MISKGLLIILLVSLALSYEKDGNTLVLKDEDFPQVINEHEYILIKFYALWYESNNLGVIIVRLWLLLSLKLLMSLRPRSLKVIFLFNKVTFARIECSENKNVS